MSIATWTTEDSDALYRVSGWGEPYFSIDPSGDVIVSPSGNGGPTINLYQLVQDLQTRGLT
ncbi:MAG TPA: hypothetical protein VFV93_12180, partial [Thermomicrobiales bacterium]|nr:hypothetical protein [Thermomicrobiales bacterium]